MLVTGKEILQHAHKNNYAVGAFNISNLEIAKAVLDAASECKAPVILQTSESAIKYAGFQELSAIVKVLADKTPVPVALHLDHGTTYETIIGCIRNGWTSVMIDGSHHPLEENIAVTSEIIKVARAVGVSVEAELGRLSGVEDNISVSEKDAFYTDPQEAVTFVKETDVDSLAISIGTAHGKYKGIPKLDLDRLQEIKKLVNIPIVLHGASGVPEDQIREATKLGVNKINIDTDIRVAFSDALKEVFQNKPEEYDPRKLLTASMANMKKVVMSKIEMFGSCNKA
ncbi:class II fructose-1,6-bisphosphate aldolase [Acetivibrio sp. MSJd-27]|jgi:fructose-1,6-bisphosphate aldolase, class II|uniref:class II fructose-1,6-bisphosphate aldolase n=1 Tax=Acetivibrio sp. MSJd-27 TaxID=2841523 RepID=UPI0015AAB976|nr:class II fructose-1,6-bisphosphate aldolase [Acetivibrio sp. MSJd-27]MBU5449767.1 class II fructose-1,6-bisphosphate aldolase [Acetivibrio sp. MSJd-27]